MAFAVSNLPTRLGFFDSLRPYMMRLPAEDRARTREEIMRQLSFYTAAAAAGGNGGTAAAHETDPRLRGLERIHAREVKRKRRLRRRAVGLV